MEPVTAPAGGHPGFAIRLSTLALAGVSSGAVVIGLGSRLAMLLLRLTSGDRVHGLVSDDGFTIGQVTLSGTYNLCHLGAAVGVIGAGAYRLVAPWLLGPPWFRRTTCALGAGAVVGSLLVHADGIDFRALQPTWLAVALFVALPALFAAVLGDVLAAARGWATWVASGPRKRWLVPVLAVAAVPGTLLPLGITAVVLAVSEPARRALARREMPRCRIAAGIAVRGIWLSIAVAGAFALTDDIRSLA